MHSLRTLCTNHHRSNADETSLSLSSHDHTMMIVLVISLANNLVNTSDSPPPPPPPPRQSIVNKQKKVFLASPPSFVHRRISKKPLSQPEHVQVSFASLQRSHSHDALKLSDHETPLKTRAPHVSLSLSSFFMSTPMAIPYPTLPTPPYFVNLRQRLERWVVWYTFCDNHPSIHVLRTSFAKQHSILFHPLRKQGGFSCR